MNTKIQSKSLCAGLTTMVASAAFIAGLLLNTAGLVPTAEALSFSEETKRKLRAASNPIKTWYFTGRARISGKSSPFVARLIFDRRTPDKAGSRMHSRDGRYAIKEFVLTTKDHYIVNRTGEIKIHNNSVNNAKDTIELEVKNVIRSESTMNLKYFNYQMICYGSKKDNCGQFITSDKLPNTPPGGRWGIKSRSGSYDNIKLSRVSQLTDKPMALLRKPIKAPPPTTQ